MYIVRGSFPLRKIFYRKGYFKMMNLEDKKVMLKEIWESEKGIKSAFQNACQMFLMLSQDEKADTVYLDMLWGGIIGVLSASAINEYAELELNYDGEGIWVNICGEEYIVIDRFNRGDGWVDFYKNGTSQYWEMCNY